MTEDAFALYMKGMYNDLMCDSISRTKILYDLLQKKHTYIHAFLLFSFSL